MEEFVTQVTVSKREGKYHPYISYRVTLPRWLVDVYKIEEGDYIRMIFKSKVAKTRRPRTRRQSRRLEEEEEEEEALEQEAK